jgi:hypothetical protein
MWNKGSALRVRNSKGNVDREREREGYVACTNSGWAVRRRVLWPSVLIQTYMTSRIATDLTLPAGMT